MDPSGTREVIFFAKSAESLRASLLDGNVRPVGDFNSPEGDVPPAPWGSHHTQAGSTSFAPNYMSEPSPDFRQRVKNSCKPSRRWTSMSMRSQPTPTRGRSTAGGSIGRLFFTGFVEYDRDGSLEASNSAVSYMPGTTDLAVMTPDSTM